MAFENDDKAGGGDYNFNVGQLPVWAKKQMGAPNQSSEGVVSGQQQGPQDTSKQQLTVGAFL